MSEAIGRRQGMSARDFEPLGVLVEHRVDYVDERLVAREEAVPARQEVAFEPALAEMLAQDLHRAAVRRHVVVGGEYLGGGHAGGGIEDGRPAVGGHLVGAEDAEVSLGLAVAQDVADELPLHARGLGDGLAGLGDAHGVIAEIGELEVLEEKAAVGVGVGAHPPLSLGGQLRELRPERAPLVEELLGPIALHPLLEEPHVVGPVAHIGERHLVRAE